MFRVLEVYTYIYIYIYIYIHVLFCSLIGENYTERFFYSYVEIFIQNADVRSSLIRWLIC